MSRDRVSGQEENGIMANEVAVAPMASVWRGGYMLFLLRRLIRLIQQRLRKRRRR